MIGCWEGQLFLLWLGNHMSFTCGPQAGWASGTGSPGTTVWRLQPLPTKNKVEGNRHTNRCSGRSCSKPSSHDISFFPSTFLLPPKVKWTAKGRWKGEDIVVDELGLACGPANRGTIHRRAFQILFSFRFPTYASANRKRKGSKKESKLAVESSGPRKSFGFARSQIIPWQRRDLWRSPLFPPSFHPSFSFSFEKKKDEGKSGWEKRKDFLSWQASLGLSHLSLVFFFFLKENKKRKVGKTNRLGWRGKIILDSTFFPRHTAIYFLGERKGVGEKERNRIGKEKWARASV